MPVVSVVMGVYRVLAKEDLVLAVDSILSQSFTDFEFIICDDGSPEESFAFLRELAEQDERIILLQHKQNRGLAAALNTCLQVARGEFVARQDADDASEPDRLAKQVAFLRKNKRFDFVGSCIRLFDEQGEWGQHMYCEWPQKRDFLWGSPFTHGSVLFRREALFRVGLYRDAKVTRRCEDYDLFMRMYAQGCLACNLQELLYRFREDQAAAGRRKYIHRVEEFRVRWSGFWKLGLMPVGVVYAVKPLFVGLIPHTILHTVKNLVYRRKE